MARDEFEVLPGVGPSIAADLRQLGVKSLKDLARRDPEKLYSRLCDLTHEKQDPCVLYVFRCAVYASRTTLPKRELLEWPAWMERRFDGTGRIVKTEKGVPVRYRRQKVEGRRQLGR